MRLRARKLGMNDIKILSEIAHINVSKFSECLSEKLNVIFLRTYYVISASTWVDSSLAPNSHHDHESWLDSCICTQRTVRANIRLKRIGWFVRRMLNWRNSNAIFWVISVNAIFPIFYMRVVWENRGGVKNLRAKRAHFFAPPHMGV